MENDMARYGELNSTVFDTEISKKGTSHVVVVTKAIRMMGLDTGDLVRVTLEKIQE